MRRLFVLQAAGVLTATFTAAGVSAQAIDRGPAVDPNVGDRGPNAASLRLVDPGNAQHSFAARLTTTDFRQNWSPFQAVNPIAKDPATGLAHSQGFRYTAPGIRALMDRPDYLVGVGGRLPGRNIQPNTDGAQAMIIPANTVFQLTLESPRTEPPEPAPVAGNYMDLRVSPLPVQSTSLRNPVGFSVDGTPGQRGTIHEIDASQLNFPAAAFAARPSEMASSEATGQSSTVEQPQAENEADAADKITSE